ncbi:hypothetical protein [Ascidiaceihabitans sp.]|uniref:hypothetical protein n=1 Tax=Ascidiaceihabitans sp. TaxID=1872644 RepID=UPI003299F6C3
MSLSSQIRKHIHPVLVRKGFEKFDAFWHLEKGDDWLVQVEAASSKFGNDGLYHLTVDIGFFSRQLDELMGWLSQAGFNEQRRKSEPVGVARCHFEASLFDFNHEAEWVGSSDNLFLPKGKASETDFLEIASKLECVLPASFERYGSFESLINCKRNKIGKYSQSKQASMYASGACIELGRFDEAREFLDDAVRPGSIQFMKDVGARLSDALERKTSGNTK